MRPTEHGFVGPLAGELEEYIRFKASMGRHGATRVQVLRSFDRHCLEHGAVRLERGVVERWIAHRIDANPGGCRSWFSYIRDFGRWMRLAHDPDAYVLSDQWNRILDTHLGSGSSRIAAYKMGFDFWGTEIDEEYFNMQEKRFREECFGEVRLKNGDVYVQKELFEL